MMNRQKHISLVIFLLLMAGSQAYAQVVIGPESSLTVSNGGSLFIGTDLLIRSDNASSGHFCNQNPAGGYTVTGDVTVERYLTADGWHNVSAPVQGSHSTVFTANGLVFYYDETIILNDWEFGWVLHDGVLSVMSGYDVYVPDSPVMAQYVSAVPDDLNDGSYSVAVTRTDVPNGEIESRKGWNLIGNPYPSPLDWLEESGWNKNDINDAKYIWNPAAENYTIFLGGANPVGLNGGTRFIPANQGFWVQAVQNGSVQVNNRARCGIMENTPNYYKSGEDYPVVLLEANADGFSDQTIVRFLAEATEDFDRGLDAYKPGGRHGRVPQIGTRAGNSLLAVNSLPEITDGLKVDVDFRCGKSGYYQLLASDKSRLDAAGQVYLEDRIENRFIYFDKGTAYHFYHDCWNDPERFCLHFNPGADPSLFNDPAGAFSIYFAHGRICLKKNLNMEIAGRVLLYNINGQRLAEWPLQNAEFQSYAVELTSGLYVVTVKTEQHEMSEKISIINQ
ncbi:MAG: T9SS type A sorting domain-containing protein [Bacteroidales bacterium]